MKNGFKRTLSLLLSLVLVIGIFASVPFTESPFKIFAYAAVSGTCGDNLTWVLDYSETLTISGTGNMTTYPSASSVPWYSFSLDVKSVVINSGVTSIGSSAFDSCKNLTSITIPDSVTSIGSSAFEDCTSLASITIPDSVTSIGSSAFEDCTSLTSVTIPDSVTSIGSGAFRGCTSLTSITIPDNVTSIGNYAFYNCKNLTSVTIGNSVTSIGSSAFEDCTSLTSVTIPDSVTSIGSSAFEDCTSLTSVYITDIAAWCNINFNNSISFSCFSSNPLYNAKNLYLNGELVTNLVIPEDVTSIGNYAFYNYKSLTSVTIGNSVTSIGSSAFGDCTSLTSITIPDNVTSIGEYAFYNCKSLTSVTIGNSVTSIGSSAFEDCKSLTSVYITDIAAWCNINFSYSYTHPYSNPLYYADNLYLNGELVTDLVIPEDVTSIGKDAFYNCKSLTSVTIPDGVTRIGSFAFCGCENLTSVYISDVTNWCNIDFSNYCSNPLYYANNLYLNGELVTNLVIPEGVTSIGSWAFEDCDSLTSITIPDSVISIGNDAFYNCTSLTSITIPDNVTSIGEDAFHDCRSLTSVTIGDSVTSIGEDTFRLCISLTSITIPDNVTSIGNYAFYNCDSLETVYYGGSEEDWNNISIGSYNTNLRSANILFNCKINSNTLESDEAALTFKVLDNDTLLNNEKVVINNTEYDTGNGTIDLSKNDLKETNTISVLNTASDYYEETFKLKYLDDSSETIYLEKKKSDIKPYINYVYYKNTTSGSNWKNAAGEKITIHDTSEEYFNIAIGATAQTGEIARICLSQDGLKTLESTTGIFSDKQLAKEFKPDKDIIAYCIDTNGNVSPAFKTEITIENVDENVVSVLNDGKVELFSTSGTSFEISDDVPFLGGTEIGLDFASLPISVSVEGSKYKVAIGLDNKTFTKDEWNLYKKALEAIDDMGIHDPSSDSEIANDRQRYKKMQELRKAYGAKAVTGKAVGNGSFDWNILGFVEWEVVNGSPVITDSYIGLAANAGYSWQTPYVVLGVPCYTELGVGVSASVGGSASRIIADSDIPIEWDIKLSIKPSLSLGAGVGCPSFLSLGVEGKGEIEWYQEFLEKYRKIDLTLSASVKAKAFLLSFDKEFATKTWNLWSGTYGSDSQSVTYAYPEENLSSGSLNLLDSDNYNTLAARDYISQTEWIGGYIPTLFSTREISVRGYENSLLQTSIYSDSRQQLVEFNGGKMLVWIMDDTTRKSANRTELVYSLYDETTATWSEPVAVCDDGTADFLPDVVSDGENVWVTWQNMNATFTEDTATMGNYSAASEIYVAKYNSETGEFETAIRVTNDTVVDSMPSITAENGNVSVAWVSNSKNDYFGLEGINSINTASISSGVSGDVETVKTDLTSVSSIDCKLTDGALYIAYAYDLDNDYNDMSDMEIYQLKVSDGYVTEARITENSVLDSAPQYSELGNEAALVWYSEGNYNILSLDSNESSAVFAENVGATDIYDVAQSAGDITYIIWSQTVGEQVAFYGAVYDGSEWGEPVLLGEASGKALNPSAVVDDNGTMFVVYNNVVQEQVTETVEETGEEFTYYKDIQTDLALLKVYQNSNISLNDDGLEIDAETVFPGEIIPLTFNVKNNGTTSVDSIDVYIDGVLDSIVQVELLPGEETSATVNYTVPETITEKTLSITAEPSDSSDYDSTDNELSVSYGYTELDVNDVTSYSTALKNTITARICNVSAVDSGAFSIRIHENDANGAIISAENFDNLAVGEALFITQEFDKSSMVYDENGVSKYYIEVVTDSHEYLTGNNNGLAVFTEENNLGITSELLRESAKEGFVHAYGVIQNNEFAEHEVYAKIEVLDEAGNVIGLKFKKVSLTDKQTYTLDENVHISGEYYETRLTLLDVGTEDISLRIPDGVTTIEELDFEDCSDVIKLIVPESVQTIGADAFSGCENLTVYCYPNSVAHTYAVDNSIPYVLYQILGVGDTTIDTHNKIIFTDIYESRALADFLTVSGYTVEVAPATENAKLFGTASTIDVYWEGELDSTYKLIVLGDTNGDSVCDTLDAAETELIANGHKGSTIEQIYAANGCVSDEIDVVSFQTVVNTALAN